MSKFSHNPITLQNHIHYWWRENIQNEQTPHWLYVLLDETKEFVLYCKNKKKAYCCIVVLSFPPCPQTDNNSDPLRQASVDHPQGAGTLNFVLPCHHMFSLTALKCMFVYLSDNEHCCFVISFTRCEEIELIWPEKMTIAHRDMFVKLFLFLHLECCGMKQTAVISSILSFK